LHIPFCDEKAASRRAQYGQPYSFIIRKNLPFVIGASFVFS
jgi:hypothetical protein